jgi:hypothetical protein
MPKPVKVKSGKLNKKIGPLPVKYWILVGIAAVFVLYLYLRNRGANSVEGEGETAALLPYSAVTPQQAASAGTPSANTPVTSQLNPETLAALGIGMPTGYITGTDLQSQLDTLGSNLAAQVAQATFQSVPSTTTPAVKTPTAVKTATGAPVKRITKPAPAKAPIRYYTFAPGKAPKNRKADEIKAVKGKSIKYRKGSGYYYG